MAYNALAALASYEDTENWDDDNTNNEVLSVEQDHMSTEETLEVEYSLDEKKKTGSRSRPTLRMKNQIVQDYYKYTLNNSMVMVSTNEFSIRAYVQSYNNDPLNTRILHVSNLSKWIRAERRGEYMPWSGINKLDSRTCKIVNIVRHLDLTLKTRDACHGVYNKVVKSPTVPGEYGVVARRFTPAGTFLGFYKGEVISGLVASKRIESQEYMFALNKNRFIDAKAFDSCFARYYNCAMRAEDQNVSVERLDSKNPLMIICFIANRDVVKGDEFLISYGSAYWERAAKRAPANSPFRRVCNVMLDISPDKYETLEPLYSMDAPDLAAEFGDRTETEEQNSDDNNSDSDYTEE
jgi:hypothetical protein